MMYRLRDDVTNTTFDFDTFDHDENTIQKWLGMSAPVTEEKNSLAGLSDALKRQSTDAYDFARDLDVEIVTQVNYA